MQPAAQRRSEFSASFFTSSEATLRCWFCSISDLHAPQFPPEKSQNDYALRG
jgi:hypothetical protein